MFILGGAKFGDASEMIDHVLGTGMADSVLLVGLAGKEPLRHQFRVRILQDSVSVADHSLYMRGFLPSDPEGISDHSGTAAALAGLREAGREDSLLRDLRILQSDTGTEISFRYSSRSVRRVLCSGEDAEPALRYTQAAGGRLYDDIRLASDFTGEGKEAGRDRIFRTGLIASVDGTLQAI